MILVGEGLGATEGGGGTRPSQRFGSVCTLHWNVICLNVESRFGPQKYFRHCAACGWVKYLWWRDCSERRYSCSSCRLGWLRASRHAVRKSTTTTATTTLINPPESNIAARLRKSSVTVIRSPSSAAHDSRKRHSVTPYGGDNRLWNDAGVKLNIIQRRADASFNAGTNQTLSMISV